MFSASAGHFNQQYGQAAYSAARQGCLLAADSNCLHSGLMLQEVEGAFTILAQVPSFLHMFSAAGHPLEPTAIQRDEPRLRARACIIASLRGCVAFVFMASILDPHGAHGNLTAAMTKD